MRKSTITKHLWMGPRSEAARDLGSELRRQRRARGLTQAQLGGTLTRSFVSGVERGLIVPSLASLVLFADRLGTTPAALISAVNFQSPAVYASGPWTPPQPGPGPHAWRPDARTRDTSDGGSGPSDCGPA